MKSSDGPIQAACNMCYMERKKYFYLNGKSLPGSQAQRKRDNTGHVHKTWNNLGTDYQTVNTIANSHMWLLRTWNVAQYITNFEDLV